MTDIPKDWQSIEQYKNFQIAACNGRYIGFCTDREIGQTKGAQSLEECRAVCDAYARDHGSRLPAVAPANQSLPVIDLSTQSDRETLGQAADAYMSITGTRASFAAVQRMDGHIMAGLSPIEAAQKTITFFSIHNAAMAHAKNYDPGQAAQDAYEQFCKLMGL